jgi:hypothetical protein
VAAPEFQKSVVDLPFDEKQSHRKPTRFSFAELRAGFDEACASLLPVEHRARTGLSWPLGVTASFSKTIAGSNIKRQSTP